VRGAEFADKRSRTVMIVLDQPGGPAVAGAPSSAAAPRPGGGSRVGLIVAAVVIGGAALGAALFIAMQYLHR
jgi:hypothetical protein